MKTNLTKIIIGGILIILGGFFFLRTAGVIPYLGISFWYLVGFIIPGILLFIGIKKLIRSNITSGIILTSLGLVFLLTHVSRWNFFSILWPVLLVAIGLSLFFKRENEEKECCPETNSSSSIQDDDDIKDTVLFWGINKGLTSKNFKSANIDVVFGGYKLDLTKVKIGKGGAVINVTVAFGGVEIIVPKGYKIVSNGTGVFGGWENKIDNKERKTPTITINGTAIFGGVDIKE